MKKLLAMCLFALLSTNSMAFTDPKVGGMVTLKKGLESKIVKGGVLYVYARRVGEPEGIRTPPVAVFRYANPRFPQAFVLTQKDVLIAGNEFQGPFVVSAKYAPNGDASSSENILTGTDAKFPSVELGNKKLNIELQ